MRRADHSSRGVLQIAVRRCVWSRNLLNEEAMAHWGLSRQKQIKNKQFNENILYACAPREKQEILLREGAVLL